MKKAILLLLCSLGLSSISFGQEDRDTSAFIQEFKFIPLPVLAANPAVGFMYGVAPSGSWMMGPTEMTHRSSFVGSVVYTTMNQLLITMKSNVFTKDDKWNLLGDWRYFITSQPTFGLGTGPQTSKLVSQGIEYDDGNFTNGIDEAQMMEFNYFRFHQSALKRIEDTRFFVGVGYHLDIHSKIEDPLLDLDSVPPTITSHYGHSIVEGFNPEEYTASGVSINALYDSRDNAINPYSGRYAFANLRINPEFLGSSQSSSMLWLEYRDYFNLDENRPRHLIGFWAYGNFVTSGSVPYLDLPAVGWDQFGRSGRAYPQGRFRGEDILYSEVEYRFPLQKEKETFGGVVFANGTTASNRNGNIDLFEYVDPGVGLGLRIMLDKNARTNLTLDYAWGAYGAQGFYLNVNETF
ncbi:BamA/TamA family outer membrane protein [Cryomorphaceae bacterium 1068]|nr:BamA/TamA family outer membrane protein [Cryomorphaceae bacterium 1068]